MTQKSSGHHKVDLTYKDFKDSWYGFLSLLEIDFAAGSVCGKCGTEPEHIVCDATGLSHQKKFSTLALQERPSNIYIPKYSYVLRFLFYTLTIFSLLDKINFCLDHQKFNETFSLTFNFSSCALYFKSSSIKSSLVSSWTSSELMPFFNLYSVTCFKLLYETTEIFPL